MKSVSISICKVILAVFLCALAFLPCSGCTTSQMGETVAEGHRRHKRNFYIYNQELMSDIDKVLLLDKPSKLTDRRIP